MAITVKKATKEKRPRDRKRGRILLLLHDRIYHLSRTEVAALIKKLQRCLKTGGYAFSGPRRKRT